VILVQIPSRKLQIVVHNRIFPVLFQVELKTTLPNVPPSLEPSPPYGQLPILEVDGVTIAQSMAISRYLACQVGLAGTSDLVKAQVDEVVDVINDVQNAIYGAFLAKDEEKIKKVGEETIPKNLANLEKVLEARGAQFFAGNSLTWAELHFLQLVDLMSSPNPKVEH